MLNLNYEIMRFPDGEVQVKTDEINHKEIYVVDLRITNAEELFIADQIMDILDRHEVVYYINISYLMGMRMDRVMEFNRPFTLKLVAEVFNRHNPEQIFILEPHSDRTEQLIARGMAEGDNRYEEVITPDYQLVCPDAGACARIPYQDLTPNKVIYCEKVRNVATGKIESLRINNPEDIDSTKTLIIIDDLCDGGGTFLGLHNKLTEINSDLKIDLYVTHMVNPLGYQRVCDKFHHVYTTNSYKEWKEKNNSTIFNVTNNEVQKETC